MANAKNPKIAVVIPCYNEEPTVGKVIDDFQRQIPSAVVYVFDNCSTDATAKIAQDHGAVVIKESRKGKGFVVERIFDCVDADFYLIVDGDDTYSASYANQLLEPVINDDADMVVGARLEKYTENSFRPLHVFGNNLVRWLVNCLTGARLTDIMSGYRAFNRRVIERIPVVSAGFEIETELTLQMLYYKFNIIEITVPYQQRPAGSTSKLRTFHDGFRILWKIFSLFRALKPLTFFGSVGLVLGAFGILAGFVPIHEYITAPDHYISHVPLAILATGLIILSCGSIFLGILLHSLNWRFLELHNVLTRRHSRGKDTGIHK